MLPGRRATMGWWARPFLGQATQAGLGLHHLGREEVKWETRGERRGERREERGERRGEERRGERRGERREERRGEERRGEEKEKRGEHTKCKHIANCPHPPQSLLHCFQ